MRMYLGRLRARRASAGAQRACLPRRIRLRLALKRLHTLALRSLRLLDCERRQAAQPHELLALNCAPLEVRPPALHLGDALLGPLEARNEARIGGVLRRACVHACAGQQARCCNRRAVVGSSASARTRDLGPAATSAVALAALACRCAPNEGAEQIEFRLCHCRVGDVQGVQRAGARCLDVRHVSPVEHVGAGGLLHETSKRAGADAPSSVALEAVLIVDVAEVRHWRRGCHHAGARRGCGGGGSTAAVFMRVLLANACLSLAGDLYVVALLLQQMHAGVLDGIHQQPSERVLADAQRVVRDALDKPHQHVQEDGVREHALQQRVEQVREHLLSERSIEDSLLL